VDERSSLAWPLSSAAFFAIDQKLPESKTNTKQAEADNQDME
jgi:hypothetical protein